jgi:hypothetical protein
LAELDLPLDLREATLQIATEVIRDPCGYVAQLRLGVQTDPQRSRLGPRLRRVRHGCEPTTLRCSRTSRSRRCSTATTTRLATRSPPTVVVPDEPTASMDTIADEQSLRTVLVPERPQDERSPALQGHELRDSLS